METFFFQDDAWQQRVLPLMLEVVRAEFFGPDPSSSCETVADGAGCSSAPATPACPHCGSHRTVKRGFAGGFQRYACKACGKTFSARTLGSFANSHVTWDECCGFVRMMMRGATVRNCSEELGLSVSACLALRHRICACLENNQMPLQTEMPYADRADVTYFRESFSGNHASSPLPRPARIRAGDHVKRGISDAQICLLTILGGNGCIVVRVLCHGRPTSDVIRASLERLVDEGAILVADCDGSRSLVSILERSCMQYLSGEVNDRLSGNAFFDLHRNLHAFLDQFKGVSTANLPDYLSWFQWMSNVRTEDMRVRYRHMLGMPDKRG